MYEGGGDKGVKVEVRKEGKTGEKMSSPSLTKKASNEPMRREIYERTPPQKTSKYPMTTAKYDRIQDNEPF